jgi:hypothetical protein
MADGLPANLPLSLVFDASPEASTFLQPTMTIDGSERHIAVWIPDTLPGIFPRANDRARLASAIDFNGQTRSFSSQRQTMRWLTVRKSNHLQVGRSLLFSALLIAKIHENSPVQLPYPRHQKQKGRVTILNNVIDPTIG